jgi:outer membrane protein OmpA-like peptidoglycan-associated protein
MSNAIGRFGIALAYSVVAGSLALSLGTGSAGAGEKPTSDSIVKSLTPKQLTRSLSGGNDANRSAQDVNFIDTLRHRPTRSLSDGEREKIATIAKSKPSIDLEINFEYNSARIGQAAATTVNELGKALTDPTLKGNTFILAGYADASGKASYNQGLSERRADSVKQYLMEKFGIESASLVTVGYGSTHFKNTKDPYAAENRRVAVTNMTDSKVADK